MMEVEVILIVVAIYLLLGVIFVVPFLLKGLTKVDESAHKGTIGFKLIIIPGVIIFWPLLLRRWLKTGRELYFPPLEK